ncbi:MAG: hypothetical protein K8F92_00785 [Hyphomicrobium sp.]|uniref:hypothetical protein n=1 Tax=Hyphomicrobium sp. TaxID=82 RepID=UPI0013242863|nr:hypothetical protein [Hyphomicrobium sp.]KAB2939776.1 MAG: hypothetical protein F9K20_15895 [Hyphomicrobium sp.]MBZ0208179.1 hypothetical protein [Hyphomicrobium sp.]
MSNRFKFEPQSTLQKVAARFRHPRRWREKAASSIFDNESGMRLQLACDEEELIRRLNVRLPGENDWPLCPVSFDDVASAIIQRRLGYVFQWARISSLDAPRAVRRGRATQH